MTEKSKEMCAECGKVFLAGKYTFLCPDCRKKEQKQLQLKENKKRNNREIKAMDEIYVMVKCLDGEYRPKRLTGIYCKHYKFDKDCFFSGCCVDEKKKYQCCTAFEKPLLCENFIFKYGEIKI